MKAVSAVVLAVATLFCAVQPAHAQLFGKKRNRNNNLVACYDQQGFSYTTLTVVISVKPTYNMQWKFPEAPSVVAERLLNQLNANSSGITFREANGVVPNLYINVTMSETNDGTQQDSAYVEVTGLGRAGTQFRDSSGVAPYTSWRDAIDHLSTKMLSWFTGGWHNTNCRMPDGSVRAQ